MQMYMKQVQTTYAKALAAANNGKGLDVAHGQKLSPH